MTVSHWKFWCNARTERAASRTLARFVKKLGVEPIAARVEAYWKGGHVVSFRVDHGPKARPDHIYNLIGLGQRVGFAWSLLGSISSDLCGISNDSNLPGITMIQWEADASAHDADRSRESDDGTGSLLA